MEFSIKKMKEERFDSNLKSQWPVDTIASEAALEKMLLKHQIPLLKSADQNVLLVS